LQSLASFYGSSAATTSTTTNALKDTIARTAYPALPNEGIFYAGDIYGYTGTGATKNSNDLMAQGQKSRDKLSTLP
jgi:hypothetical protein